MARGLVTVVGAVVLAAAVLMLAVASYSVVEIVKDPSARLAPLKGAFNVSTVGPNASFAWAAQGYNVSFTDTSTDNGSTIVSWAWEFGDGTGYAGSSPPTHTYTVGCPRCTEQVTLGVTDAAGDRSVATAEVQIGQGVSAGGVSQASGTGIHVPNLGPIGAAVGALEITLLLFLIGASAARAGYVLLRREPETVEVPVRPLSAPGT